MARVRSVRELQLFYSLAGERFSGVRRACAGHNIWGGLFDWGRGGPQGSWKARGSMLELRYLLGMEFMDLYEKLFLAQQTTETDLHNHACACDCRCKHGGSKLTTRPRRDVHVI